MPPSVSAAVGGAVRTIAQLPGLWLALALLAPAQLLAEPGALTLVQWEVSRPPDAVAPYPVARCAELATDRPGRLWRLCAYGAMTEQGFVPAKRDDYGDPASLARTKLRDFPLGFPDADRLRNDLEQYRNKYPEVKIPDLGTADIASVVTFMQNGSSSSYDGMTSRQFRTSLGYDPALENLPAAVHAGMPVEDGATADLVTLRKELEDVQELLNWEANLNRLWLSWASEKAPAENPCAATTAPPNASIEIDTSTPTDAPVDPGDVVVDSNPGPTARQAPDWWPATLLGTGLLMLLIGAAMGRYLSTPGLKTNPAPSRPPPTGGATAADPPPSGDDPKVDAPAHDAPGQDWPLQAVEALTPIVERVRSLLVALPPDAAEEQRTLGQLLEWVERYAQPAMLREMLEQLWQQIRPTADGPSAAPTPEHVHALITALVNEVAVIRAGAGQWLIPGEATTEHAVALASLRIADLCGVVGLPAGSKPKDVMEGIRRRNQIAAWVTEDLLPDEATKWRESLKGFLAGSDTSNVAMRTLDGSDGRVAETAVLAELKKEIQGWQKRATKLDNLADTLGYPEAEAMLSSLPQLFSALFGESPKSPPKSKQVKKLTRSLSAAVAALAGAKAEHGGKTPDQAKAELADEASDQENATLATEEIEKAVENGLYVQIDAAERKLRSFAGRRESWRQKLESISRVAGAAQRKEPHRSTDVYSLILGLESALNALAEKDDSEKEREKKTVTGAFRWQVDRAEKATTAKQRLATAAHRTRAQLLDHVRTGLLLDAQTSKKDCTHALKALQEPMRQLAEAVDALKSAEPGEEGDADASEPSATLAILPPAMLELVKTRLDEAQPLRDAVQRLLPVLDDAAVQADRSDTAEGAVGGPPQPAQGDLLGPIESLTNAMTAELATPFGANTVRALLATLKSEIKARGDHGEAAESLLSTFAGLTAVDMTAAAAAPPDGPAAGAAEAARTSDAIADEATDTPKASGLGLRYSLEALQFVKDRLRCETPPWRQLRLTLAGSDWAAVLDALKQDGRTDDLIPLLRIEDIVSGLEELGRDLDRLSLGRQHEADIEPDLVWSALVERHLSHRAYHALYRAHRVADDVLERRSGAVEQLRLQLGAVVVALDAFHRPLEVEVLCCPLMRVPEQPLPFTEEELGLRCGDAYRNLPEVQAWHGCLERMLRETAQHAPVDLADFGHRRRVDVAVPLPPATVARADRGRAEDWSRSPCSRQVERSWQQMNPSR